MDDHSICSINGKIVDQRQAFLPLSSIEAQYGFGVYENIKVRNNIVYFVKEHIARLIHSATCIGLEHRFSKEKISDHLNAYKNRLNIDSCNLKLILLGEKLPKESRLIIMASSPFYPKREWYRTGVTLKSDKYERFMPQAKTLNMLPSYIFYKNDKRHGHYDSLLIDMSGNVLEGTRTNVFFIEGKNIYHPPTGKILVGVTMMSIKCVLEKYGFKFTEKEIPLSSISKYEGMFLSSTSSKILPICKVDDMSLTIPDSLHEIIKIYNEAVDQCKGRFDLL